MIHPTNDVKTNPQLVRCPAASILDTLFRRPQDLHQTSHHLLPHGQSCGSGILSAHTQKEQDSGCPVILQAPQGASLGVTATCTRSVSTSADLSVASHICPWSHCLHIQNFNHFYMSFTFFVFSIFSERFPWCGFQSFFWFLELRVIFWGLAFVVHSSMRGGTACSK